MNEKELKRKQLISLIIRKGFPKEFGIILADELHTEKQMSRMIGYLLQSKHVKMEDIVDEMLAIQADFASYRQKKITEYNNAQYNTLLAKGIDDNS